MNETPETMTDGRDETVERAVGVERLVMPLREELAEYAHEAWSGWMLYLFEKSTLNPDATVTIPAWAVERWTRQCTTPYEALPEEEKASDRREADRMLAIMGRAA